jgi:hypothetical protein
VWRFVPSFGLLIPDLRAYSLQPCIRRVVFFFSPELTVDRSPHLAVSSVFNASPFIVHRLLLALDRLHSFTIQRLTFMPATHWCNTWRWGFFHSLFYCSRGLCKPTSIDGVATCLNTRTCFRFFPAFFDGVALSVRPRVWCLRIAPHLSLASMIGLLVAPSFPLHSVLLAG